MFTCSSAQHPQRSNGERWEREACTRCRQNGAELEGLACDDTDPARLCIQGKCSNSICHDKPQGSYCETEKWRKYVLRTYVKIPALVSAPT
uniref:Uncharacterized protein n=1 Tax=Ascaris suum TaxID=6253 RepID=F1LCN5_ASCSU